MTGRHAIADGDATVEVDVPTSGGENVMVPVIRAIVRADHDAGLVLLQRRADPSEGVVGKIEIPGGRWRAGEDPSAEIRREVYEETGVKVSSVDGIEGDWTDGVRTIASVRPFRVVAGAAAAFPAVHVIVTARGSGEPRDEPGETADVRWWPIAALREALVGEPESFVPYAYVALSAYAEVDAGS